MLGRCFTVIIDLGLINDYIFRPSDSPALQKNFDRFSGLINEFGRPERASKPQTVSKSEITTCTALFSFKAISPK